MLRFSDIFVTQNEQSHSTQNVLLLSNNANTNKSCDDGKFFYAQKIDTSSIEKSKKSHNNDKQIVFQDTNMMIGDNDEKNDNDIESEIERYTNCIKELINLMKMKKMPKEDLVELVKHETLHFCSKKVELLHDHMVKEYQTTEIKGEIEIETKQEKYKEYFPAIKSFLTMNDIQDINPKIKIGPNCFVPLNNVIRKYNIIEHDRIPELKNCFGVRAIKNIPKYTVLGQYIGVLTLKDEYNTIYNDSSDECLFNTYNFDIPLNVWINNELHEKIFGYRFKQKNCRKTKRNKKKKVEQKSEFELKYPINKTFTVVCDALRLHKKMKDICPFMFVNDCRKDINMKKPTYDDFKYWNIEYVTCYDFNSWPRIFIVTRCDIKCGQELYGYYGENFGISMAAKIRRDEDKEILNNKIQEIEQKLNSIVCD